MSLKLKVNLLFTAVMLIIFLASTAILITNARKTVRSDVQNTVDAAAKLIVLTISNQPLNRTMPIHEQIDEMVGALSEIRSLHILMFDSDGLMFEGEPAKVNVPDSNPPQWFSKLLFPQVKPLFKRFSTGHLVIYADPTREIVERWRDIRGIFILGLAMFLLTSIGLYLSVGRFLKPLQRLLDGLSGFERGDLHLRLPKFSSPEMNRLSQTFNKMGQALELSMTENQKLAMLVRQSSDAILALDKTGKITFSNYAAEKLFAKQKDQLQGQTLADFDFSDNKHAILEVISRCESVENMAINFITNTDSNVDLLMSTVPFQNNEDQIIGLICTLHDVTVLKQVEQEHHKLRETRLLAQHLDEVQEAERRHLAQELHDELGQCLTAIKTDAVLIRNRSENTEPKIHQSSQAIIDIASHIYDVVHTMITRLRPSPLDDLGLVATLEEAVSVWQKREANIQFELETLGPLDNLSETYNITVFRVVQESITNAVRHAAASLIHICVVADLDNQQLRIDIRDDGKGMEVKDIYSDVDFGLLGMRERVQSLNGQFMLQSELDAGLHIRITIPMQKEGENNE